MWFNNLKNEVKRLSADSSFEGQLQRFYQKIVKPGDVIIDIGAHTGRHTLPFSFLADSVGKVIAIEASTEAIVNLRSQLYKYKVNNVEVFNLALSNKEESQIDFFIAVDAPEESGLLPRKIFNVQKTKLRKEKVDMSTLDSLNIKGKISFIKIDVEGAEFFVLQGSYKTISSNHPIIAFEFGQNSYDSYDVNPDDAYEYFESLGYNIFSIHGDLLNKETFSSNSVTQNFWDYIACPKMVSPSIQSLLISSKNL